jgi:hypothetical protein
MKEIKAIEVDGTKYAVNHYITSYGIKLLTEIFKLLGESMIKKLLEAKEGAASEIDPEKGGQAIAALTAKLDEDTADRIIKKILCNTLPENSSFSVVDDYDERFRGRYIHLFKLTFKTLEVQYGDFLGALGGFAKLSKAVAKK